MSGNNNEHKNCFVSYHFIYILSYHIIINQSINQSNLFIWDVIPYFNILEVSLQVVIT